MNGKSTIRKTMMMEIGGCHDTRRAGSICSPFWSVWFQLEQKEVLEE